MVFCEVVYAINVMYKFVIHWPTCVEMQMVMDQFKRWCGLPCVQGVTDKTHIVITKPSGVFAK
jgi:hypothetical protein